MKLVKTMYNFHQKFLSKILLFTIVYQTAPFSGGFTFSSIINAPSDSLVLKLYKFEYRTRAIKGRALYSKNIFCAPRLPHKKLIKVFF